MGTCDQFVSRRPMILPTSPFTWMCVVELMWTNTVRHRRSFLAGSIGRHRRVSRYVLSKPRLTVGKILLGGLRVLMRDAGCCAGGEGYMSEGRS